MSMDEQISKKAALVAVKYALMAWSYMPEWRDEKILEAIAELPSAQPEVVRCKDWISRQSAIDAFNTNLNELVVGGEENAKTVENYLNRVLDKIKCLPPAQPEIVRCKDCKYWVHGYITDNDDFILPKCGEWKQMVGHSSDDYCSLAERREVTT